MGGWYRGGSRCSAPPRRRHWGRCAAARLRRRPSGRPAGGLPRAGAAPIAPRPASGDGGRRGGGGATRTGRAGARLAARAAASAASSARASGTDMSDRPPAAAGPAPAAPAGAAAAAALSASERAADSTTRRASDGSSCGPWRAMLCLHESSKCVGAARTATRLHACGGALDAAHAPEPRSTVACLPSAWVSLDVCAAMGAKPCRGARAQVCGTGSAAGRHRAARCTPPLAPLSRACRGNGFPHNRHHTGAIYSVQAEGCVNTGARARTARCAALCPPDAPCIGSSRRNKAPAAGTRLTSAPPTHTHHSRV
jgi:hypothetical protein